MFSARAADVLLIILSADILVSFLFFYYVPAVLIWTVMDVCCNYGQNFLLTYLCHKSIAFERHAKVRQQTLKVVFEKDGSERVLIESGRPRLAVSPPADKPSRCSRR